MGIPKESGARAVGIRPYAPKRIIYEATGPYHRALEQALAKADLPQLKVNPTRARRFAQVIGKRAKTDAIDAAMLARFGAVIEMPLRPVASKMLHDLKELSTARRALIKDRTAAQNRQKNLLLPLLKRQTTQRLAQIAAQIKAIDAEQMRLLYSDPELHTRLRCLLSIPGIGATTAMVLLVEMPELGTLDKYQAASLASLAPITHESGKLKGTASIRAGRTNLRRALYMPALVATMHNPVLKATYQALRNRGKAPKVALVAVMRKLVILANSLIRRQQTWTPKMT